MATPPHPRPGYRLGAQGGESGARTGGSFKSIGADRNGAEGVGSGHKLTACQPCCGPVRAARVRPGQPAAWPTALAVLRRGGRGRGRRPSGSLHSCRGGGGGGARARPSHQSRPLPRVLPQ